MKWAIRSEKMEWRSGAVTETLSGRPVAPDTEVGQWSVPLRVQADSKRELLVWYQPHGDEVIDRKVRPQRAMLRKFVTLGAADASMIVAYAKQWGVLGVCEQHHVPGDHSSWDSGAFVSTCTVASLEKVSLSPNDPVEWHNHPDSFAWEPLETWRIFARIFRAIITISNGVQNGGPVDAKYWTDLYAASIPNDIPPRPNNNQTVALAVSIEISKWLKVAGASPEYSWSPGASRLQFQPHGLFGALVLALAASLSASNNVAICFHCKREYFPERQPRATGRHFCEECREGGKPVYYAGLARDARVRVAGGKQGRTKKGKAALPVSAANVQPSTNTIAETEVQESLPLKGKRTVADAG